MLVICLIFSPKLVMAQMHCRTTLGSHLTPIMGTDHLLALEATVAPGVITGYRIQGGMLLGAFDFSLWGYGSLYLEGGYKNWQKTPWSDDEAQSVGIPELDSRHVGARQIFYSFDGRKSSVRVGLHETKLGNYYLVDERILGASFDRNLGAFDVAFRVGTVLQNFARMGKFCLNRHLYDVIDANFTENIGEKPGETNLLGGVLSWAPKLRSSGGSGGGGEFSEFEMAGEFSEFDGEGSGRNLSLGVDSVGLVLYQEFGTIIEKPKRYGGVLMDWRLPSDISMRTGTVYQNMTSGNALAYMVQGAKSLLWDSGMQTEIGVAYFGLLPLDEDAVFQPLFSNLFIGEVMRLDATSFPIWTAEVKHRFAGKHRFSVALKGAGQTEAARTKEVDLEIVGHFVEHVQSTLIFSRIVSEAFEEEYPDGVNMARLEVRVAF